MLFADSVGPDASERLSIFEVKNSRTIHDIEVFSWSTIFKSEIELCKNNMLLKHKLILNEGDSLHGTAERDENAVAFCFRLDPLKCAASSISISERPDSMLHAFCKRADEVHFLQSRTTLLDSNFIV